MKRQKYKPKFSDTALLILGVLREAFIESFWPHPYYHTFCKHANRRSFRNALERLKKRGLILSERQENGRIAFYLSDNGEKLSKRIALKLELSKTRPWDGKWRLLIFDIPEKTRAKRDFFRRELRSFGFYQLQKSVWAYPYPIGKDFFELWSEFNFKDQLVLVESAKIDEDKNLRAFFGL
jgi:DNA-binding transcriptional regulator PaaX